ncbi:MAG: protein adenylyltransferase SelO family protein, partial [Clostridium sp.]
LARFAEALLPLLHEDREKAIKIAENAIGGFKSIYEGTFYTGMRRKLGLFNEEEGDEALIHSLLALMEEYRADYTNTFCDLTLGNLQEGDMYDSEAFRNWNSLWMERIKRCGHSEEECRELMKRSNPTVIPRNFRVEEALDAAVNRGDYSVMELLLDVIRKPFDYGNINEEYRKAPKFGGKYKTYCGT